MSEPTPPPRRILHLVIDDFSAGNLAEIVEASPASATETKIFSLTKAAAPEALDLIFHADTIAAWSHL
jgi:hypothetical protein